MGTSVSGKQQEPQEGLVTFRKSPDTTMNVVAYVQARVESGDRVVAAQDSRVFSSGFEGGNADRDSTGPAWMPSVRLLTVHHRPHERGFGTANATSAATALAARMAAHMRASYPDFWPETVRALMVHSAEWTDAILRSFLRNRSLNKKYYLNLVRDCGFGVPDANRALWSEKDSLTLIAQE